MSIHVEFYTPVNTLSHLLVADLSKLVVLRSRPVRCPLLVRWFCANARMHSPCAISSFNMFARIALKYLVCYLYHSFVINVSGF
jgi:hypothetical protein